MKILQDLICQIYIKNKFIILILKQFPVHLKLAMLFICVNAYYWTGDLLLCHFHIYFKGKEGVV